MRMLRTLLAVLLIAPPAAAADALADLRATLARFPADAPFTAAVAVDVHGDAQSVASRSGSSRFHVTSSANGLDIRLGSGELTAAENEARAKKRDPEQKTPTRTAMVAVTVFDIIDAVDAASMLLNDLDEATLVAQAPSIWHGKPATLLRIDVKPTLVATRFVSQPKIELRLWLDANGVPIAAERESNYSASFFVVSASNSRIEHLEFAVSGDRLYATRWEEVDRASAIGKKIVTSRSITFTPHAGP